MEKLVNTSALTKINSVTVETEYDPDLGCATSPSPRTCVRWLEIQYHLSLRLKGTMTIGRLNLMTRSGLEPTVRIDICETSCVYQLCHKNNLRNLEQ